jgi:hypothetical protein
MSKTAKPKLTFHSITYRARKSSNCEFELLMRRSRKFLLFLWSNVKKFPIKIVTARRCSYEWNIDWWTNNERRFSSFFLFHFEREFRIWKPIFMNEISMLIAWFLLRLCSDRFVRICLVETCFWFDRGFRLDLFSFSTFHKTRRLRGEAEKAFLHIFSIIINKKLQLFSEYFAYENGLKEVSNQSNGTSQSQTSVISKISGYRKHKLRKKASFITI